MKTFESAGCEDKSKYRNRLAASVRLNAPDSIEVMELGKKSAS